MTSASEDPLKGLPAAGGDNSAFQPPSIAVSHANASEQVAPIDRTTTNAKRVLAEEAEKRADKTARLRAARQERDANCTD